jgi:ribosomal protein L29
MAKKKEKTTKLINMLKPLRSMQTPELLTYVHDSKKALLQSRVDRVGQKPQAPHAYRHSRRNIARALTLLREAALPAKES